jgi:hypothetical protein
MECQISWPREDHHTQAQVKELKDLKLSAQLIRKLKEDGEEQREGDITSHNEESNQADGSNKPF